MIADSTSGRQYIIVIISNYQLSLNVCHCSSTAVATLQNSPVGSNVTSYSSCLTVMQEDNSLRLTDVIHELELVRRNIASYLQRQPDMIAWCVDCVQCTVYTADCTVCRPSKPCGARCCVVTDGRHCKYLVSNNSFSHQQLVSPQDGSVDILHTTLSFTPPSSQSNNQPLKSGWWHSLLEILPTICSYDVNCESH